MFRVGDKVRCKENPTNGLRKHLTKGGIYTVKSVLSSRKMIELDGVARGWSPRMNRFELLNIKPINKEDWL